MNSKRILSILIAGFIFSFAAQSTPLVRSGSQLIMDGKPVRLIGYGCYGMISESSFESEAFLDRLAFHRINLVRVWVLFHWTNDLTPFEGNREDLYDLLHQNAGFYSRLRDFVGMAEQRGIVVQVCLFDGVALTGDSSTNRWPFFPYNTVNNLQDYLATPGQFNDIPSQWWSEVDVPLIDRIVEELGDFGNVIYEAMNEPDTHGVDTSSPQFNPAVVDRLHERLHQPEFEGSKVISVNPEASALRNWAIASEKVDLISYHIKNPETPLSIPEIGKPILISNDGDDSQMTEAFGGLPQTERLDRIREMLIHTFTADGIDGAHHFECLDKGLYGSTWRSHDYNPRYENRNEAILQLLSEFVSLPTEGSTHFRIH